MRIGPVVALVVAALRGAAVATPTVTAASSAGAGALVMDGEGTSATHIVKIAEATLSTDAPNGLTISVTSGTLATAGGHTPVPFQVLLVDHAASAPTAAAFTTPATMTFVWSTTTAGAVDKDLYIKYTPAQLQDPGAYTASVDLDVVDN